MRSEKTSTAPQMLGRREDYILDKDGSHKAAGLEVVSYRVGFDREETLSEVVKRLTNESKGKRGARRKHVAWEFTFHPTDANGAKCAFRSLDEMKRVADEVIKEFKAKYALIGFHGLQDIHILMLNWGETGLGLKSYLPSRSNPRRVMVAVADRIEKELNIDRRNQGFPPLITMAEVREKKRKERGRPSLHGEIARHLDCDKEPSVLEILAAISACGWQAVAKRKKVFISFEPERPSSVFELDLFHKGVIRAWRLKLAKAAAKEAAKEQESKEVEDARGKKEVVPFELLGRALTIAHREGKLPAGIEKWLRLDDNGGIVEQPALKVSLESDSSAERDEYLAQKNAIIAQKEIVIEQPDRVAAKEQESKEVEDARGKKEVVPFELLARALTTAHQQGKLPTGIQKWLRLDANGAVVEQPALKVALESDSSSERNEYLAQKNAIIALKELVIEQPDRVAAKEQESKEVEDARGKKEVVPFELLARALTTAHREGKLPTRIEKWLLLDDNGGIVEQPALKVALESDSSVGRDEYLAQRNAIITLKELEIEQPDRNSAQWGLD